MKEEGSTGVSKSAIVGRFAPSPTGRLHAGNIFAALMSWLIAKADGGSIVCRIEDLDPDRSKQEYADAILFDFEKLGLTWDVGPIYQSKNSRVYAEYFEQLRDNSLTYPCFCTRAQQHAANAPHVTDRFVYSGACRNLDTDAVIGRMRMAASTGRHPSFRFKVEDVTVSFNDLIQGHFEQNLVSDCGDFIIKRSDGGYAYNLASVVDDFLEGINCIVRGVDLLPSTPGQIYLQRAFGFTLPQYAHIPLFCATDGRRLAKRNAAASIDELMAAFGSYEGVLGHIAYMAGIKNEDCPTCIDELLDEFIAQGGVDSLRQRWEGKLSIEFTPS